MSSAPGDRKYTTSHEWALEEDGRVVVGITDHAVAELGDLVFIELPEIGTELAAGDAFGEIESVKAVSELNAPVSGTVVEINEELASALAMLSESPFEDGWLIKIEASDLDEIANLMSAKDYKKQLEDDEG